MVLLHLCLIGTLSLNGIVSSGGSTWSTLGQPIIGEVEAGYVLQSGFWYWIQKPTGVEEPVVEVEKPLTFRVRPNPARGAARFDRKLSAEVYDVSGRLVAEVDGDRWIPPSSGVFFLRVGEEVRKVAVLR